MTQYVVDASVAAKWFLNEDLKSEARTLLFEEHSLLAPDLLMAEVGNTLWKSVRRNLLDADRAREAIGCLLGVNLSVLPCAPLIPSAFEIGSLSGCSLYDAIYVALAVELEAKLITADKKLHAMIAEGELKDSVQLLGAPDNSA